MFRENEYRTSNGLPALLFLLVIMALAVATLIQGGNSHAPVLIVGGVMVVLAGGRVDVATGIPWQIVGLSMLLGVAVAMLSAAYPARVASRLSIVRAVQYE